MKQAVLICDRCESVGNVHSIRIPVDDYTESILCENYTDERSSSDTMSRCGELCSECLVRGISEFCSFRFRSKYDKVFASLAYSLFGMER